MFTCDGCGEAFEDRLSHADDCAGWRCPFDVGGKCDLSHDRCYCGRDWRRAPEHTLTRESFQGGSRGATDQESR